MATKKNVVVPVKSSLPAWAGEMDKDVSKGVSQRQEDNLIPMMRVLQALSPQVKKQNEAYIPGAEEGMIFIRGLPEPVISGDEGVTFQPCHFTKKWVEWVPRKQGGGIVERYEVRPDDCTMGQTDEGRPVWKRPNGNEVVETRYHSGYVYGERGPVPVVIPLSSTGHSFSKEWMLAMNMKKTPTGKTAPSFAFLYHLTTKPRSNAAGDWFSLAFTDEGPVGSLEDYQRGRDLFSAIEGGSKQYDETRDEAVEI